MSTAGVTLQIVYAIDRCRFGRRRLAESTGLTEMTVRLELERLRSLGLLELSRSGPRLTKRGLRRFHEPLGGISSIRSLPLTTLRVDEACAAALVSTSTIPSAWAARDIAVRGGGSGLVLLRHGPEGWAFAHDDEPVALRNAEDAQTIEDAFRSSADGDYLLFAYGPDEAATLRGLWAALAGIFGPED
jgi:hypothetical protein